MHGSTAPATTTGVNGFRQCQTLAMELQNSNSIYPNRCRDSIGCERG